MWPYLRDDTVEFGAGIAEALLASAESTEVLDGPWDDIIVKLEVDAAGLLYCCKKVSHSSCPMMLA